MKLRSSGVTFGRISIILIIWSPELTTLDFWSFVPLLGLSGKQEFPLNKHLYLTSQAPFYLVSGQQELIMSESMQPRDHRSTLWSYCFSMNMISGGRYHLEMTWFDKVLYRFVCLSRFDMRYSAMLLCCFVMRSSFFCFI